MNLFLKGLGLVLYLGWGASTAWELIERAEGESISIVGQLFFSVGIPYLVLFLIVLWFMKRTGLDKLPQYMERLDTYMQSMSKVVQEPATQTSSGKLSHDA